METTAQVVRAGPCPPVYVPVQQTWTWPPCRHLSWSCWTTSPVRVMVCRSEYSGFCCWLPPPWASAWVSGWTMDMWTFRLWAFSKRFPHIRHANSRSASALCLVMWYFSDARWRHWKPHTSHLKRKNKLKAQIEFLTCLSCLCFWFSKWKRHFFFILNHPPKSFPEKKKKQCSSRTILQPSTILSSCSWATEVLKRHITYCSGLAPECLIWWTERCFLCLKVWPHWSQM